jgi:tetratricopeptide (TPR) repeat protein
MRIRTREFEKWLESALNGDSDAIFNIGAGVDEKSLENFRRAAYAVASRHGVGEAAFNLGILFEAQGKNGKARKAMERAASLNEPQAPLWLGYNSEQEGDLLDALKWYSRSTDVTQAPLCMARVLRKLGREAEALDVLYQARRASPEIAVEWATASDSPRRERVELLEQYAKSGEKSVLIPLANLLTDEGRVDEAVSALRQSVASGEPNAGHNLGVTLFEAGHREDGIVEIRKAAHDGDQLAVNWLIDHELQGDALA